MEFACWVCWVVGDGVLCVLVLFGFWADVLGWACRVSCCLGWVLGFVCLGFSVV